MLETGASPVEGLSDCSTELSSMSFMCEGFFTVFQGECGLLPAWTDARLHTHLDLPVCLVCLLSVIYYCYRESGSGSHEGRGSKWP